MAEQSPDAMSRALHDLGSAADRAAGINRRPLQPGEGITAGTDQLRAISGGSKLEALTRIPKEAMGFKILGKPVGDLLKEALVSSSLGALFRIGLGTAGLGGIGLGAAAGGGVQGLKEHYKQTNATWQKMRAEKGVARLGAKDTLKGFFNPNEKKKIAFAIGRGAVFGFAGGFVGEKLAETPAAEAIREAFSSVRENVSFDKLIHMQDSWGTPVAPAPSPAESAEVPAVSSTGTPTPTPTETVTPPPTGEPTQSPTTTPRPTLSPDAGLHIATGPDVPSASIEELMDRGPSTGKEAIKLWNQAVQDAMAGDKVTALAEYERALPELEKYYLNNEDPYIWANASRFISGFRGRIAELGMELTAGPTVTPEPTSVPTPEVPIGPTALPEEAPVLAPEVPAESPAAVEPPAEVSPAEEVPPAEVPEAQAAPEAVPSEEASVPAEQIPEPAQEEPAPQLPAEPAPAAAEPEVTEPVVPAEELPAEQLPPPEVVPPAPAEEITEGTSELVAAKESIALPPRSNPWNEIQNYLDQNLGRPATPSEVREAVSRCLADSGIKDATRLPSGTELKLDGVNEYLSKIISGQPDISAELSLFPEEVSLPTGSSPWAETEKYLELSLGRDPSPSEIAQVTKEVCRQSGIKVSLPGWDVPGNTLHTELRPGYKLIFNDSVKSLIEKIK